MIGHFAKDRLVISGEAKSACGGAVYYGSIALARLGYKVAVITRLSREDLPLLGDMKQEGIAVFASEAQQTSGMENIYPTEDQDHRICHPLGFAGQFEEQDIPDIDAGVILVAPILAGEITLQLLEKLSQKGRIGLDAQGFVRFAEGDAVVFRDWPNKKDGLALVHYLKVDDVEAEVLTGESDYREAATQLACLGPKEIILTHRSGVLVYADGDFIEASFSPREIVGRTGRGDTCFSTYVGERLYVDPRQAIRRAAAVTSLKMEVPGPFESTSVSADEFLESG